MVLGLSSLGDWLGLLAATALATNLSTSYQGASFALGAVLVVRLLPAAVLGPVAGAFVDRFDRRYTMVVCDLLRFGLTASIPIVGSLSWLFVASFLIECVGLFWIPAKEASVPNLVRHKQIEAANQISLITTYGITPVVAAAMFSLLALLGHHVSFLVLGDPADDQVSLAFFFNALTFLLSAVVVFTIRRISEFRGSGERPQQQPGVLRLFREGLSFIGTSPLVRGLLIGILGAFAAAGAVIGTGKLYAESLSAGDAAYGIMFGAVFVGVGLGIAFGPKAARDFSRRRLFGLSIVLAGCSLVLVAFMPHLFLAVIAVLGVGFTAGIAYLSGVTLLGSEVDDEVRGRTFALVQSLVRVDLLLSLAAVPFLVGLVNQRRVHLGGLDFVVDGTRILLVAAGLLAVGLGTISYRQMDDRRGVPLIADLVSALRGDTTTRRRLSHGGVFVVFEGGEGAGKSTQVQLLARSLREEGLTVTVTHEPGATELGARIRQVLLHSDGPPPSPRAEALLFAADRAHHVHTVIRPALDAGSVVLCDRYVDSSLAYQGAGRDLPVDEVRRLSRWATGGLEPDLTVLLDLDPAVGLRRARDRSAGSGDSPDSSGSPGSGDRLEGESLEYHQRVRAAFRALAEGHPERYLVVDASATPEAIAGTVRGGVHTVLEAGAEVSTGQPAAGGGGR